MRMQSRLTPIKQLLSHHISRNTSISTAYVSVGVNIWFVLSVCMHDKRMRMKEIQITDMNIVPGHIEDQVSC